jgi:hypothetical protein
VPAEQTLTLFEQAVRAADPPLAQCSGGVLALPARPLVTK